MCHGSQAEMFASKSITYKMKWCDNDIHKRESDQHV